MVCWPIFNWLLIFCFQSIMSYNGGAIVAMKGKNCVAIAADKRFGVQAQTLALDFQVRLHDRTITVTQQCCQVHDVMLQHISFAENIWDGPTPVCWSARASHWHTDCPPATEVPTQPVWAQGEPPHPPKDICCHGIKFIVWEEVMSPSSNFLHKCIPFSVSVQFVHTKNSQKNTSTKLEVMLMTFSWLSVHSYWWMLSLIP
jgi:hypothetical protein